MANFEKVMEDMEVKTGEIDATLENVYSATVSQDEVASLLQQIGDGQAMAGGENLVNAGA